MRLFHGSTVTVKRPNIQKGRKATDFGKGFYTTTNFEQAKKWALLKKNREQSEKAIVSVYEVPDDILDREYPVLRFMGATKEWLEFVVNNRRGRENGDYDLIMGPVANDQLYATIRLYEQRVVTAEAAIEMLKAHKLFNQLSFHTVTVALLLKFVESIEVEYRICEVKLGGSLSPNGKVVFCVHLVFSHPPFQRSDCPAVCCLPICPSLLGL